MSFVPPTRAIFAKRALLMASAMWVSGMLSQHVVVAQQVAPTVAVFDFVSAGLGEYAQSYAPLGKGIPDQLLFELQANPAVRIVDRAKLQQILAEQNLAQSDRIDPATAVRIGKLLGVQHILAGSFVIQPDGEMAITVNSTNVETSQVEKSWQKMGKADKVLQLIGEIGKSVSSGLNFPPPPAGSARQENAAPDAKNQLKLLMLMGRAQEYLDNKKPDEAVKVYKEALAIDSNFGLAKTRLAALDPHK